MLWGITFNEKAISNLEMAFKTEQVKKH